MGHIILKTSGDDDKKDAILDRLRDLGINKLLQRVQPEKIQPSVGVSGQLGGAFSRAVTNDPEKEKRTAVETYDRDFASHARTPSVPPELTFDGSVHITHIVTPLSDLEIVTNFTGPTLPTFADTDKDGSVVVYESLDLAASILGTRYVMEKIRPHVEEYNNDKK